MDKLGDCTCLIRTLDRLPFHLQTATATKGSSNDGARCRVRQVRMPIWEGTQLEARSTCLFIARLGSLTKAPASALAMQFTNSESVAPLDIPKHLMVKTC